MNELTQSLLLAFANNFTFYLKSHNYHWVVMGENFPQYHTFLEGIYTDAQESIDDYAEQLRRLGAFPRGDYTSIVSETELTDKPEDLVDPEIMFQNLLDDLTILVTRLQDTYDLASDQREYGLQNFLADRIDTHRKQQWQLTATLAVLPEADVAATDVTDLEGFDLTACPLSLQDAKLNLANHLTTIEDYALGPADPRKPENVFWMAKADLWGVSDAQARTQLCGNCSHYISTTPMMECITNSPGGNILASNLPVTPKWADIPGSPSGFCDLYDITCTATRTCDSWASGGPIDDARAAELGLDPLAY
jgi:starvation-inducible DNA-binding protein